MQTSFRNVENSHEKNERLVIPARCGCGPTGAKRTKRRVAQVNQLCVEAFGHLEPAFSPGERALAGVSMAGLLRSRRVSKALNVREELSPTASLRRCSGLSLALAWAGVARTVGLGGFVEYSRLFFSATFGARLHWQPKR